MTLTSAELRVTAQVARGLTNGEIAAELHIAEGTVKLHITNALRRTGLRNRVELALAYVRAEAGEPVATVDQQPDLLDDLLAPLCTECGEDPAVEDGLCGFCREEQHGFKREDDDA